MPVKIRPKLLCSLIILMLLLSVVSVFVLRPARAGASGELRSEIERLRRRLSEVEGNISQFENNLTRLEREKSGLSRDLSQTQLTMQRVEAELEEANIALEIAELEVRQAEDDLERAEAELDRRIDLLNRRVRAMYELGTVSYLEVLLTATSFGDFVRRFQTLQEIVTQDVAIVDAVSEQRDEVEDRKNDWTQSMAEADAWRVEVAARKSELQAQAARYQAQLSQLSSQQREYRDALDQMERLSEEIAVEIAEAQRQLALGDGVPYLQWPLDRGTYWISSPYGPRYHPILGQHRIHTGVDLAASTGTTIRASAEGQVLDAGWMGGYGLTVIIAHTRSTSTLYAHASSLLVSAGQRVSAGQAIARVGSTGFSTGPHLHFEVRIDGQHKNPMDYLPAR